MGVARHLRRSLAPVLLIVQGAYATVAVPNSLTCVAGLDPDPIPNLVAQLNPSVVTLIGRDEKGVDTKFGTGFVVATGQVVTNRHVVTGIASLELTHLGSGRHKIEGLKGAHPNIDLVLLSVDPAFATAERVIPSAEGLPKQGQRVFVLGSPVGLDHSLTDGIVSAIRELKPGGTYIQMTAAISPGSSGSPVFGVDGRVLGIATASRVDGQDLNFAIPIGRLTELHTFKAPIGVSQWNAIEAARSRVAAARYLEQVRLRELLEIEPTDPGALQEALAHLDRAGEYRPNTVEGLLLRSEILSFDAILRDKLLDPARLKRSLAPLIQAHDACPTCPAVADAYETLLSLSVDNAGDLNAAQDRLTLLARLSRVAQEGDVRTPQDADAQVCARWAALAEARVSRIDVVAVGPQAYGRAYQEALTVAKSDATVAVMLEDAQKRWPTDPNLIERLAECNVQRRRHEQALSNLSALIQLADRGADLPPRVDALLSALRVERLLLRRGLVHKPSEKLAELVTREASARADWKP